MVHLITTQKQNNTPLLHIYAYLEKRILKPYSLADVQWLGYVNIKNDYLVFCFVLFCSCG